MHYKKDPSQIYRKASDYGGRVNLRGKICLITGATSGIGYATAVAMSKTGCQLILTARTEEKGDILQKDFQKAIIMVVNFENLPNVMSFVREVAGSPIFPDFVLLNHGIQCYERIVTPESFEKTLQVNFISQLLVVETWLRSGCTYRKSHPIRIGFVSSGMHRMETRLHWDDLNFEEREYSFKDAYCQSKLLQMVYLQILYQKASHVTWFATEPGPVKTEIYRPSSGFEQPPWEGFDDRPSPDVGAYPGVFGFIEDITQGVFINVSEGRPSEISAIAKEEINQEMLKVLIEDVWSRFHG